MDERKFKGGGRVWGQVGMVSGNWLGSLVDSELSRQGPRGSRASPRHPLGQTAASSPAGKAL